MTGNFAYDSRGLQGNDWRTILAGVNGNEDEVVYQVRLKKLNDNGTIPPLIKGNWDGSFEFSDAYDYKVMCNGIEQTNDEIRESVPFDVGEGCDKNEMIKLCLCDFMNSYVNDNEYDLESANVTFLCKDIRDVKSFHQITYPEKYICFYTGKLLDLDAMTKYSKFYSSYQTEGKDGGFAFITKKDGVTECSLYYEKFDRNSGDKSSVTAYFSDDNLSGKLNTLNRYCSLLEYAYRDKAEREYVEVNKHIEDIFALRDNELSAEKKAKYKNKKEERE
jgi:hypothetical protein